MLGVIIGIAAVIILVSLMESFQTTLTETFESFGTNLITATVVGRGGNRSVTVDDMYQLAIENDEITAVSPRIGLNATIKYGNKTVNSNGVGGNEFIGEMQNYQVQDGRFLQYIDSERRLNVCLIGTYIRNELFDGQNPIGQTVKVNGHLLTVVGLLEEKQGGSQSGQDNMIIVPYTVAMQINGDNRISTYIFGATDKDHVSIAMAIIEGRLLRAFGGDSDAFILTDQSQFLDTINEVMGQMQMLLVGIAAISLLVGGIGIMNIMLVSVTERTKEIGIRKSLGARRVDILKQFIIEAAVTSAIGGVIGIIIGGIVAVLMGQAMGFTVVPSTNAITIAFGVSVAIGMFFGYFPAGKASKLNPIDALRYD